MLGSAFDEFTDAKDDYYPPKLRNQIDKVNLPRPTRRQQRRVPLRVRPSQQA